MDVKEREVEIVESEPSSPSAGNFKLFDQLELQEFKDKYVFRAVDSPTQGFSVDRSHGGIDQIKSDDGLENPGRSSKICGVAGTIRMVSGTYILVITSSKQVGTYVGFPIFRVQSMKFLTCNQASQQLTAQEKKAEAYLKDLLKVVESTPGLYYSYETDITLNFQRQSKLTEGRMSKPIWKQADPRFVWNRSLIEELIECKLDGFIIPLLQGNILYRVAPLVLHKKPILSFQTVQVLLKDSPATLTLMSRRCTRRLGTRMWRRGANLEGDTANFIESEQLLEFKGFRSSFMQVRGSIPLIWEQIVDLSYKPQLNIIEHEDTSRVVDRHFHDLSQRYGKVMALDLTDQHGDEGQLSAAYATEMKKLPDVRYTKFDFHLHCGSSNFDNLKLLYDEISDEFEKQGYFLVDGEGNWLEEQKGVIRSNCIDCLDRTNVTQSFLGQKSLNLQLQRIGVFTSTDCISQLGEEYDKFKILWVDHGDEISLEYAGTHALKRDLVRYGKQTLGGLIADGMSALSRYYLNNFQDGDAIDLVSGRYSISRGGPSLQISNPDPFSYFPVASAIIIGGLTITSLSLNHGARNSQHIVTSVIWAGLTAGMMALAKTNGRRLCSRPRLSNLR
ncbi:hypothetical protein V2J09_010359 [Rumex salicifolius]